MAGKHPVDGGGGGQQQQQHGATLTQLERSGMGKGKMQMAMGGRSLHVDTRASERPGLGPEIEGFCQGSSPNTKY